MFETTNQKKTHIKKNITPAEMMMKSRWKKPLFSLELFQMNQ
jgi:hypothetical protein